MPTTTFAADWKAAKDRFVRSASECPPEISMLISVGRDFGPALKAFDSAAGFEKRMKCMPAVLRARTEYVDEINQALKKTTSRVGRKSQEWLLEQIDQIWTGVQQAAQPPRPTGQMVAAYTLREFNLAGGLKVDWLKVGAIPVVVDIEVDKAFKELIDTNQAGLRAQDLGDIAAAELETVRKAFRDTIVALDAKIKKAEDPEKLIKEANEVLTYYGRLVEDRVNTAVQTEWKAYLGRKKDLHDFRVKSATKVVLGTIGVAVAVASAAATFGTAWMNIIAACKGFLEVAKTLKTWSEQIDTVYEKLLKDIVHVEKLNAQREAAKKKGAGQKASKAAQAGKEVIAGLLPLTKDLLKAGSAIQDRCVQYSGLVAKLESQADAMSARIELITRNLNSVPNDRLLTTSQINLNRRMNKAVTDLMKEIAAMNLEAKQHATFAAAAKKAALKLAKEDSWSGGVQSTAGALTKSTAIYALANFITACADNGKQLLTML